MNHETDDIPRFDDPRLEREWLLQEHAMRRERLHLDPAGDDARSQRYRALARALRTASPHDLPADFARQMGALVWAAARPMPAMRFENMLARVLGGVLLLAALVATFFYGAAWWPQFRALLPTPPAAQWWLALLGCVALSWLLGAWSRRAGSAD